MRWETKDLEVLIYKEGDTRLRHRFLLWPKTIGGHTRWLEMARYSQVLRWKAFRHKHVNIEDRMLVWCDEYWFSP